MSGGVKVTNRGAHGLEGASTYHSVLSLWAERARVSGLEDDAMHLSSAATLLEEHYAEPLRVFLSYNSLDSLVGESFFWKLADATAKALQSSDVWRRSVVALAKVTKIDPLHAHLEGSALDGSDRFVDLPSELATHNNLGAGSFVFVLSRVYGHSAMVEVEPAIPVPTHFLKTMHHATRYYQPGSGRTTAPLVGMGAAGQAVFAGVGQVLSTEEMHPADAYERGPGSRLTREQVAHARESVRKAGLKARPLRPAG